MAIPLTLSSFLSIQAQDFIEDCARPKPLTWPRTFLSIQAQDFIEDHWRRRSE